MLGDGVEDRDPRFRPVDVKVHAVAGSAGVLPRPCERLTLEVIEHAPSACCLDRGLVNEAVHILEKQMTVDCGCARSKRGRERFKPVSKISCPGEVTVADDTPEAVADRLPVRGVRIFVARHEHAEVCEQRPCAIPDSGVVCVESAELD